MKKTVGSLIVAVMAVVLCGLLPAKALAAWSTCRKPAKPPATMPPVP